MFFGIRGEIVKRVYLWGAGRTADYIYERLLERDCELLGIIDSDAGKQGREWRDDLRILSAERLLAGDFDYLLITPKEYDGIEETCAKMEIPKEKILVYWRDEGCRPIVKNRSAYISSLEKEYQRYRRRWENVPFEYGRERTPVIRSGVELLEHIRKTGSSLSRFGDGEFELMLERYRPWFQSPDKRLAKRLREIIQAETDERIVVAIADDFGCLEQYNEESADAIREYLAGGTRKRIMPFIDLDREYYDAYVSRPYLMYKDKKNAEAVFDLFKSIWKDRNLILVEGKYGRAGVGNDLLSGAKSIRRILCPEQNGWDRYEEILSCVKNAAQAEDLVCVSLGPTATVMAYDLAGEGIQALDIGQVDNEYEWYLKEATQRIAIPGKMVAEILEPMSDKACADPDYRAQILAEIY